MHENWLDRWEHGRIGWHESDGNAGLKAHWPLSAGRVLVPLCGKAPDLSWLASRGHDVVGVELSEIAVRAFFAEQGLEFDVSDAGCLRRFTGRTAPITIYCGDYFAFADGVFDALYDRGAYIAVDPAERDLYARHTNALLAENSTRMVITLEYDQSIVAGPPFAAWPGDVERHWGPLTRIADRDDIDTCPPKFIKAGLTDIREVVWLSG